MLLALSAHALELAGIRSPDKSPSRLKPIALRKVVEDAVQVCPNSLFVSTH